MYYVDALLFVLQSFVVTCLVCFPLDGVLVLSWTSIVWLLPVVGSLGLTLSLIVVWQIFGWLVRQGWFHRFVTIEKVFVILHLCYLLLV
jgi:hypothetical protein